MNDVARNVLSVESLRRNPASDGQAAIAGDFIARVKGSENLFLTTTSARFSGCSVRLGLPR